MKGTGGDRNVKGTPAHQLTKHRTRLFGQLMLLLPSLKQHADFQRWEPTLGGSFPRELYEDIIQRASRISSYLTLLSYTVGGAGKRCPETAISETLNLVATRNGKGEPEESNNNSNSSNNNYNNNNSAWLDTLSDLLNDISPTQHSIICTLTLLSNALQSGHSIPPHLKVPRPYELTSQFEALDAAAAADADERYNDNNDNNDDDNDAEQKAEINNTGNTSNNNIPSPRITQTTQAGYAEFAVFQVCSSLVCDDLEGIIKSVSKLVGVVDFSYCVGSSSDLSTDTDTDADVGGRMSMSMSMSTSTSTSSGTSVSAREGRSGSFAMRIRTRTRTNPNTRTRTREGEGEGEGGN